MGWLRSSHGGNRTEESWSKKSAGHRWVAPVVLGMGLLVLGLSGCSSKEKVVTTDPPAKLRMQNVLKFYQMYNTQKGKPPPDEKSFKEYIRSLPQDQKDAAGVGEDLDSFLSSPRDGQKIHIEYGVVPRPAQNRALAWEETGEKGNRWTALTMGYVAEYNEENLQNYKKKK